MNTDLTTTLKIALTLFAVAALNQIESTSHFLLHCHHYKNIRVTLLNSIC